jgi:hypothetical protein
MKTKFTMLAIGSSLALGAPILWGQNTNTNSDTNSLPLNQTAKYQAAFNREKLLGERALLPPGLKEKLHLTDEQRAELKPIEEDFAKTSKQYQTANQPRIDAALEANRQARQSKNAAQIELARKQLQQVWAGLQPYRDSALKQVRPLLTPDQITILDAAKNQWRENHGAEANDQSAN